MGFGRKSILIVDDNEFFLQQQIGYLDGERFHLQTAASGREALERIRSTSPDLILLDQIMEDMTGPDICRILKADPATAPIPIIIVSSGERELSRRETTRAGCDGIIFKPIRREQLLGLVEEYLGVGFRKWARVSVTLECEADYEGIVKEGTILSLSAGGAFLEGGPSLLRGDTCRLRFPLPGDPREVSVREAIVVWLGHLNGDGPQGAGLKFLTLAPDDRERIDRFVAGQNP